MEKKTMMTLAEFVSSSWFYEDIKKYSVIKGHGFRMILTHRGEDKLPLIDCLVIPVN